MTTRLLAIESATDSLSIALMEGDEVVLCEEAGETRQHASVLLPLIDQAFRDVGWSIGDLDALAVSSGPGSFTSLRIGLATAKGLAFGREIQAIGVSTLEAMAAGVDAKNILISLTTTRASRLNHRAFSSKISPVRTSLVRCFPLVHRRTRALRPPPARTTCALLARPTCMIFVVFPLQHPRVWSPLVTLPRMRRARRTSATRAERRTSKAARFAHGGAARGGGISLSYCR